MYAKLKNGKIVSGKIADAFVKINIATYVDDPENTFKKKGRKPKN
jgi:hypothetical protein